MRGFLAILLLAGSAAGASLQSAVELIRTGRLADAERALLEVLASRSTDSEAHYLLGFVRFQRQQFEEAAASLQKAVDLSPDNAQAWKLLGMVHSGTGQFEAAAEPFRRACKLAPKDPDACYYLGRNDYVLARFDTSVEAFEKALGAEGDSWRVHRGLGLSLEAAGRPDEAERHLRQAVKLSRGQARAIDDPRIDLGVFLFRRGDPEEAIAPFQSALNSHPDAARAHFELARALAQLGRNEEAVSHLEAAVRLEPENWPAHLLLGKVYVRLGRVEEGQKHSRIGRRGAIE